MAENFSLILENAFTKTESFFANILPELEPLSEEKLKALSAVLESGSVIDKNNVTRLFIEHLKERGASYLAGVLDVNRPKLFLEAANILGELKFDKALIPLTAALKEKYRDLTLASVKAISLFNPSESTTKILSDFYLGFKDETILSKSIRYLASRANELVPVFLTKYKGLDVETQMWVLNYFAKVADARTQELLVAEYKSSPFEKGVYCIEGLGRIGSDEAVTALKTALKSDEWFLRKHIVTALGVSDNANSIEPLLASLADSHVLVRGSAVKSLSLVGNKNPKALIEALKTADKQVKSNLVRAMGQLKNEKFVETLVEVLKERDTLFFSIDAVGDLGFPQAEFALRRLLKDSVWFNRLNALEALEKLHSRELMTFAQEAMEDENDMVRNSASRILSSLKLRA